MLPLNFCPMLEERCLRNLVSLRGNTEKKKSYSRARGTQCWVSEEEVNPKQLVWFGITKSCSWRLTLPVKNESRQKKN